MRATLSSECALNLHIIASASVMPKAFGLQSDFVLRSVTMTFLLVLVVIGGANAGNQSLRVGQFRTLESCEFAANEAKGIGIDKGSFGFVCVRAVGSPDIVSAR